MTNLSPPPGPVAAALELLQLVVDSLPQFIFWKDSHSIYQGCNANFAKIAGVSCPEEIVGKSDFDLAWKDEEATFFRAVDRRVMDSGIAEFHIVEPQLQSDGKEAWLETNKIPLKDANGEVIGILGTFEDITERRQRQEALDHAKRLEAIGKLAGGVAHDFNNVIGGVMGAAELLSRRQADPDDQDLVHEILRLSQRAADLTSKLLTFSRRGHIRQGPVDVHEAIENIVPLLNRGSGPNIEISLSLKAHEASVLGDIYELELALLNLGINAQDAMPGGGTLSITSTNTTLTDADCHRSGFSLSPGPYIRISVQDTGHGIPPEVRHRIFEPFFTTKALGVGTGLGLSAVYGAVQQHKGSVALDPTSEVGTTFVIELPLTKRSSPSGPPPLESENEPMTGTVLVVDDEPMMRSVVSRQLIDAGFEVLVASDGEEGLKLFETHQDKIVLVLLDVVMPRMGGFECLDHLRTLAPQLPAVVHSGFARDQLDARRAQTEDFVFLKKPYSRTALLSTIRRALSPRADEGAFATELPG